MVEETAQIEQEQVDITEEEAVGTEDTGAEETNLDAGTDESQQTEAQDVLDWTKDPRYEKSWGKDFNKAYKSYRDMESAYAPLKKNYETLNGTFEELGIQPEQLKDIVEAYNTFQDPDNPLNVRANYLGKWLDNPKHEQKVINFFNELEKSELAEAFPGMTDEQIQRVVAMEEKVKAFEEKERAAEYEANVRSDVQRIEDGMQRAQALAEKRGLKWSVDVENHLLQHCADKQVDPSTVYAEFIELYGDQLDAAYAKKLEQGFLKRKGIQKDAEVIPAKGKAPAPEGFNFKDSLLKAIKK